MFWNDYLWGRFAWLAWPALIGGLFFPFWLLFIQGVNSMICSVPLTLVAAVCINCALWTIRYLIVLPTFYNPHLPYRIAPYTPTLIEVTPRSRSPRSSRKRRSTTPTTRSPFSFGR